VFLQQKTPLQLRKWGISEHRHCSYLSSKAKTWIEAVDRARPENTGPTVAGQRRTLTGFAFNPYPERPLTGLLEADGAPLPSAMQLVRAPMTIGTLR
jgi:hypothetical protein